MSTFDESAHPRDARGRWAPGAGPARSGEAGPIDLTVRVAGRFRGGRFLDPPPRQADDRFDDAQVWSGPLDPDDPDPSWLTLPEAGRLAHAVADLYDGVHGEHTDAALAAFGTREAALRAVGEAVAVDAENSCGVRGRDVSALVEAASAGQRAELVRVEEAIGAREAVGARSGEPESERLRRARAELVAEIARVERDQAGRLLTRLAGGYRAGIAKLRPLGGEPVFAGGSRAARAAFCEAAADLPADWIAASNEVPSGLVPTIRAGRGHYRHPGLRRQRIVQPDIVRVDAEDARRLAEHPQPWCEAVGEPGDDGSVTFRRYDVVRHDPGKRGWQEWNSEGVRVWRRPRSRSHTATQYSPDAQMATSTSRPGLVEGRSATYAVCLHEWCHRAQASVDNGFRAGRGEIDRMEADFLDRRTRRADGTTEEPIVTIPARGSRSAEYARANHLVSTYMGKTYESGSHEILTCGAEALFGGAYGGLVGAGNWRADPQMRNLVLGIFAVAGRRRAAP